MAFALERACAFPDLRRIIVVIPYLSIIEQNAQVFIDALGRDAILEHHSGDTDAQDDEEFYNNPHRRRAAENWDAPIIVTTSVRFFESLFSHRPSDLRRVHNLARSVVILDEVQTLPRQFIQPILGMMEDLAKNWCVTFLFCTATLPAFEKSKPDDPRWESGTIQEIMPHPRELFGQLKRVEVEWPRGKRTWKEIALAVVGARRALCIVNTRNHALALYREVSGRPELDSASVFHLSARMCPCHRLKTIAAIKERLEDPAAPCVVISTQLVEAGVDLDFPVVYRAVGPLDSIAQAAGRCDREGWLTAKLGRPAGKVIVFEPEEPKLPPGVYLEATERTQALIREGGLSIDDPDCIRRYFDRLYGEADLGEELEQLRTDLRFRDVGEKFKMIADNSQSIFVPYDAQARDLIGQLNAAGVLHLNVRRRLQRYTVGLYPNEIQTAAQRGVLYEVRRGSDLWVCPEGFYDEKLGFVMGPSPDQMVQ
jgi:CRISPR-associated endonuclease/helicase Cas3